MSNRRSSSVVVCLLAACLASAAVACRSKPAAPPPAPIPQNVRDALTGFIKHEACEATTCDGVVCEPFSDGVTQGLPAHIARCTWTDTRVSPPGTTNRCAYVHYGVDAPNHGYGYLFLSVRKPVESCEADKEFVGLVKGQGYSGRFPE